MVRTILYINEVFCQTVDQLKEIISNPQLVKNDAFRLEILSLYKDGVLEKWFEERGLSFNVTTTNSNDDDIFIRLYKEITGDNECPNFDSDFSKLGEFLRCEIDKKIYKVNNGEILLDVANKEQKVRFVFKSLKSDNNIREFTIRDSDKIVGQIKLPWNDKIKGKEYFFDIPIAPSEYEGKTLIMTEGESNKLCRISFKYSKCKNVVFSEKNIALFYVNSLACYIGKLPIKMSYRTLNDFITSQSKTSVYTLKFLSPNDIEKMKMITETVTWNMMKDDNFWIKNEHYYDGFSKKVFKIDSNSIMNLNKPLFCWIKFKLK